MDYADSGVSIQRADQLVDWLGKLQSKHPTDQIVEGVGGFASLVQLDVSHMPQPCLASCTDGVGTKLKLALQYNSLESLGQDLVAMCVNDLICTGALPLFFLDYYACSQIELKKAQAFLKGVHQACLQSGCSLVGGETAEMPGFYSKGDFDCAGFCAGLVDRSQILGPARVQKGDQLIALPSHGFHSNGYSLLRKVFEKDMENHFKELLRPTALYVDVFKKILKGKVHALAHITGGGLNNILRVAPQGSLIQLKSWPLPQKYVEVQKRAQLHWKNFAETFNCGVGMVIFAKNTSSLLDELKKAGIPCFEIGKVAEINPTQKSTWELDFTPWECL